MDGSEWNLPVSTTYEEAIVVNQVRGLLLFLQLIGMAAAEGADPVDPFPQRCFLNQTQIAAVKTRLMVGDEALLPIYQQVLREAEAALQSGPFSVMQKMQIPPSGDKHDYMSVGPYWWPDPSKPDGLPYIRRDGEVNPEYESADFDNVAFGELDDAVSTLALAYYLSDREEFANHAARLLRAWFLDEATRMNPNLEFGQAIPGRVVGRGIGIIETRDLIDVVNAIELITPSKAWTRADQAGMIAWCQAYLRWLRDSPHGKDEDNTSNNHATWYDAQVARLAIFTGDQGLARSVLENVKTRRIPRQIEPDGSQPLELARTKSFSYSVMNLKGMFELARMADQFGVDLWNYESPDHRSIKKALDYLTPYADPEKQWLHTQIAPAHRGSLYPLLCEGARHYEDARYAEAINKLPADEMAVDHDRLIYLAP